MNEHKQAWYDHASRLYVALMVSEGDQNTPFTNFSSNWGRRIRMDPFNPIELAKTSQTPAGQFLIRKVLSLV